MSSYYNKTDIDNKYPFRLGRDSSGNYGYYKDGADTVTPFKTGDYTKAQYDAHYKEGYNAGKSSSAGTITKLIDHVGPMMPNDRVGDTRSELGIKIYFKSIPSSVSITGIGTFSGKDQEITIGYFYLRGSSSSDLDNYDYYYAKVFGIARRYPYYDIMGGQNVTQLYGKSGNDRYNDDTFTYTAYFSTGNQITYTINVWSLSFSVISAQ